MLKMSILTPADRTYTCTHSNSHGLDVVGVASFHRKLRLVLAAVALHVVVCWPWRRLKPPERDAGLVPGERTDRGPVVARLVELGTRGRPVRGVIGVVATGPGRAGSHLW